MQIEQKIYDLSDKEEKALGRKRKLMEKLINPRWRKFMGNMERLIILEGVISKSFSETNYKYDEAGLRVFMGDLFVKDFGFRWVVVDDIHGKEFAIRHDGLGLLIYPSLLVSKLIGFNGRLEPFVLYHNISQNLWARLNGNIDGPQLIFKMPQPSL